MWFRAAFSELYFSEAKVFHNLITLSAPELIIYLLSYEKATVKTSALWPTNYLVHNPLLKSHNLKVLSQEDEMAKQFSLDKAKSETKWLCPYNCLKGTPYKFFSFFSSYNFQIMIVLSLDPEIKSCESSFSFWLNPATMEVTHS